MPTTPYQDQLRSAMKQRRRALPDELQREAASSAFQHLQSLVEYRTATHIAMYCATGGELDPWPAAREAMAHETVPLDQDDGTRNNGTRSSGDGGTRNRGTRNGADGPRLWHTKRRHMKPWDTKWYRGTQKGWHAKPRQAKQRHA